MNEYKIDETIKYRKCKLCNIIVPEKLNAEHCISCNICIFNFDHHCQWTGKCIGKKNIITFYSFFISLLGYILVLFFCLFLFLYHKFGNGLKYNDNKLIF